MPAFWPRPLKLKPATVKIDFDRVLLVVEEVVLDLVAAPARCAAMVAPTGVCTSVNRYPWSSSGRKAVGSRKNSSPMSDASARYTSM